MNSTIRTMLVACVGLALSACGSDTPPPPPRRDVPPTDFGPLPDLDGSAPADASPDATMADGAVTPLDGNSGDTPPASDTGRDAQSDVRVDAPPPVPGLCGLTHEQMSTFAVRVALCTGRPAQQVLTEFFRPDAWETGPFTLRPCPSLRCVTTTTGGCDAWMISCLKYNVFTPMGGVCATPPASCTGTGGTIARNCGMGRDERDDCSVGSRRCVSTAMQSACVPRTGDACAAGAPARCVGAVLEECVLGTYTPRRNCGLTGSVCDAAARGCRGTGDACTGDATMCDGTTLRACRNGRWQNLDCGRLVAGSSCQTVMGRAFCGVDQACEPSSAPPTGTCDANTLSLCAGGRTFRYTCDMANGFTSCGPSGCVP